MIKIIKGEDLYESFATSILEVVTKACYADNTDNAKIVSYDKDTYNKIAGDHNVLCGVCVEDDNVLSYSPVAVIMTDDIDIMDEVIYKEMAAENDVAIIKNSDTATGTGIITWHVTIDESRTEASLCNIKNFVVELNEEKELIDIPGVIIMKLE